MLLHAGTHNLPSSAKRETGYAPVTDEKSETQSLFKNHPRLPQSRAPPTPTPGPHRPALSLVGNLSISSNRRFMLSKTKSTVGFQPSTVLKHGRCNGTCLMNPHGQTKEGQAPSREAQPKRDAPARAAFEREDPPEGLPGGEAQMGYD